jgi:hypothetical protein
MLHEMRLPEPCIHSGDAPLSVKGGAQDTKISAKHPPWTWWPASVIEWRSHFNSRLSPYGRLPLESPVRSSDGQSSTNTISGAVPTIARTASKEILSARLNQL